MPLLSITSPPTSEEISKKARKDLALKLFIELLSIETQQTLFNLERPTRRFIEIGPRTTLATIARKSAAIFYSSHAPSQWSNLQFLSYQDDESQILYQYAKPQQSVPPTVHKPIHSGKRLKLPPPDQEFVEPKLPETGTIPRAEPSVDVSLSANHIVVTLAAQKFRQPFDKIEIGKTVRDLCGGKSTLQNELTGDLVAEFGRVPEGVEDMPLGALGEALKDNFTGKPAKTVSSSVSRLVSSKMPAGFNQGAILDYLHHRWGLAKSHAIVPICFATTIEPSSRLPNADKARSFLDDLVLRYAEFQGITLIPSRGHTANGNNPGASAVVDTATFEALSQEQKKLYRAQYDTLAQYLKIKNPHENLCARLQNKVSDQDEKLSLWNAEFDDQFLQGISPLFNEKQARNYDSWWNWSREEVIRCLTDINLHPSGICRLNTDSRLIRMLNRWDSSCTDIVVSILNSSASKITCGSRPCSINKIQPILNNIIKLGTQSESVDPVFVYIDRPLCPKTTVSAVGRLEYCEDERKSHRYSDVVRQCPSSSSNGGQEAPFVHIKTRRIGENWLYDSKATAVFYATLDAGATCGFNYSGKAVLVTGAGPDSIGAHIVQSLLRGGARVIVTTSRPISQSAQMYQQIYREHGAKGATLHLIPMNQGSKQDCESLSQYIYGPNSPTDGNLDFIVPFAAIPQAGEPDGLGARQELALRAMLVNVLRLIGFVCGQKEKLRIKTRPTMVILPLSCNEGTFGGDGFYPESKIGLKALFNRFYSESWSTYITICGAVMGWTRGTSLMRSSNMVAEEVEKLGVITFTQAEMAFNILALMTPTMSILAEDSPIYADFTGGFGMLWNIKQSISDARKTVTERVQLQNAIIAENSHHDSVLFGSSRQNKKEQLHGRTRRANLSLRFPPLPEIDGRLSRLQGMIDLSRVVVVVGYSELGPWGNSRTRWEIEHQGKFSLEGYIEMAWIMGLIKHVDGQLKGQPYVGWVDTSTEKPIADDEVHKKYHDHIMANAGLRLIEPDKGDPYDPSRKEFLQEVAVEEDLLPFESSRSNAEGFKLRHGEHVSISPIPNSDEYRVHVKKGAVLMIPKIVPFHQTIAGKIPKGWDPLRYGIPEDIVQQVDVTTLYALCCVSEAFLSAGINDPYEIYQYIHVSELTNCLGTGGGPMKVIQNMYRDRYLDRKVRGDIIVEHFLNTMGAWVNMLLLSATGPLKTPVGACATALESLEIGCEAIQGGKCKIALVGGCDDYREELAFEFANIKATANSAEELASGRVPSEISRPTASSRSGFAESAGCGVQILASAELAIEMGLPIHGIVAYTQMASDQTGRSIPAPGQGILTAARETIQARNSPLLDINFRRVNFEEEIAELDQRIRSSRLAKLEKSTNAIPDQSLPTTERSMKLGVRDAQQRWANDIRLSDPSISPIRAALATWGLAIDDIKVASMHGTSTKANDINEAEVINTQMEHLGRRKGNPLLSVCQKSLTGHPKAAAGAWQLNGCLQIIQDGIIPGNRNADNIDEQLRRFEHLVYPMESIMAPEVNAAMITSFGFGQKGALSVIISPKYLFGSLSTPMLQEYRVRVTKRRKLANTAFISRVMKSSLVQVKTQPPWDKPEAMQNFFLHPHSRVIDGQPSLISESSRATPFSSEANNSIPETPRSHSMTRTVRKMLDTLTHHSNSPSGTTTSVGVDIEDIISINVENCVFIERNFTPAEREYCSKAPNPRASFAGRWSAKEAIFKSLQTPSAGAAAAMSEIEIVNVHGVPKVILYGHAQEIAASQGISSIEVSISHSSETAVAVALALKSP